MGGFLNWGRAILGFSNSLKSSVQRSSLICLFQNQETVGKHDSTYSGLLMCNCGSLLHYNLLVVPTCSILCSRGFLRLLHQLSLFLHLLFSMTEDMYGLKLELERLDELYTCMHVVCFSFVSRLLSFFVFALFFIVFFFLARQSFCLWRQRGRKYQQRRRWMLQYVFFFPLLYSE